MRDRDRKRIKEQAKELQKEAKTREEDQNKILENRKFALQKQEELTTAYKRFVPNQFIEILGYRYTAR